MCGNIRSAPLADRLRMVQVITDCRSLKAMLAALRVRFRGAFRFSEYGWVTRHNKRAFISTALSAPFAMYRLEEQASNWVASSSSRKVSLCAVYEREFYQSAGPSTMTMRAQSSLARGGQISLRGSQATFVCARVVFCMIFLQCPLCIRSAGVRAGGMRLAY
jgi:hypothetical protein